MIQPTLVMKPSAFIFNTIFKANTISVVAFILMMSISQATTRNVTIFVDYNKSEIFPKNPSYSSGQDSDWYMKNWGPRQLSKSFLRLEQGERATIGYCYAQPKPSNTSSFNQGYMIPIISKIIVDMDDFER